MTEKTVTVNTPLAKTFGWLHVNGTHLLAGESAPEKRLAIACGDEKILILNEAVRLKAELEDNAVFRLIQVRYAEEESRAVNDIQVTCGKDAVFEWYRVILGGRATYDNCSVMLAGAGSRFEANIGYRLEGEELMDMNCEAIHTGKKTESLIRASGVLFDRASKLLRGTIDLRRGCAGAVGNETEDVLLIDDTVRNRSVPVILCSEEDVVGNHGASIGRLDEDLLFYLQSRGIDNASATERMAKARVDAIIRRIPDGQLRAALLKED